MKAASYFLLLIFILSTAGIAESRQAMISSEQDTLGVGDVFEFILSVPNPDEYEIIFPDSSTFDEDFEFINRSTSRSAGADSARYTLQFFGTSDSAISEMEILQIVDDDTIRLDVPEYPFHFKSLLSEEDSAFRPFKPLFTFSASAWPYVLMVILLLLIIAAGFYWYRNRPEPEYKSEPQPFSAPRFIDPIVNLEKSIRQIKQSWPDPMADPKAYFSDLSNAVRAYYEEMYDIPALESTTRELMWKLEDRYADETLLRLTRGLLQLADRVKFARFSPDQSDAEAAMRTAQGFLDRVTTIDGPRIQQRREEHDKIVRQMREEYEASIKTEAEE